MVRKSEKIGKNQNYHIVSIDTATVPGSNIFRLSRYQGDR